MLHDGSAAYVYGHERLAAIAPDGTRTWYLGDALGSIRMRLDDAGAPRDAAAYTPFGIPHEAMPAPFGFTGELHDAGLFYLRARWYNPGSGTFATRDPFAGYAERPYSLHPYQYAYSNPLVWTDPSGKCVPYVDDGCVWIWDADPNFNACNPTAYNLSDGRIYVETALVDPIAGIVLPSWHYITDANARAQVAAGGTYAWTHPGDALWTIGQAMATPGIDVYEGIVCRDPNQLGRGLTGFALFLGMARLARGKSASRVPKGARCPASGRPFNPETAGVPIRNLSTTRVRITHRGVDVVEHHLRRFGDDAPNAYMVKRLRRIASGDMEPTVYDTNFYTHELREFVRYRRLGWKEGQPPGDPGYNLWNDAHTATLEDYGLSERPVDPLYHPDAPPSEP